MNKIKTQIISKAKLENEDMNIKKLQDQINDLFKECIKSVNELFFFYKLGD